MAGEEDDQLFSCTPYASINTIKKYLKKYKSLIVVDLGCGKGDFLFGLKDDPELDFMLMEGVDKWDDDSFNLDNIYHSNCNYSGKSYPVIKSIQEDVFTFLSRTSISYDLIIASNLIHFFEEEKTGKFITRCYELLKPGGVMYIKMVNNKHKHYKDYETIYSDKLISDFREICPVMDYWSEGIHGEIVIIK